MEEYDPHSEEHVARLLEEHKKKVMEEILTDALNNWLDKKYAELGKWTWRGLTAMAFGGLVYFWIHTGGFAR